MDIELLSLLSNRDRFDQYGQLVIANKTYLSDSAQTVLRHLKAYYDTTQADTIKWSGFGAWLFLTKLPDADQDKRDIVLKLLKEADAHVPDKAVQDNIIHSLIERKLAEEIAGICEEISLGSSKYGVEDLQRKVKEYADTTAHLGKSPNVVTDDMDDLLGAVLDGGLYWKQLWMNQSCGPLRKGDFVCLVARPDSGKCFAKDTPVLMYDGTTKPVQEVAEGELVMGPDSKPRRVFGTARGVEQMYRIKYKNGDYYEVNESHILSLKRSKKEGAHEVGDILNIPLREYLEWPEGRKARYKGWKTGVEFDFRPVRIPPYILGVWLGDGHSDGPMFTNADTGVWRELEGYCEALTVTEGVPYYLQEQLGGNTGRAVSRRITHGIQGKPNAFREALRSYNMENNKHIPYEYLHNCREHRMDLLAGLIDTDGSVSNGCGYEITQKNKALAEGILYLIRSLGYSATLREKAVSGTTYYRVHTYGDFSELPVCIPYKKLGAPVNPKRKGLHFGFDVVPVGEGEYYGFTVDKDHLFLLGDFTVVHNTSFLSGQANSFAKQGEGPVLWINNEQEGRKVKLRIIQEAVNLPNADLKLNPQKAKEKYEELVGPLTKVVVVDKAGITAQEIEALCEEYEPCAIIIDQLWKVKGFGSDNSDVRVQTQVANWARELCKKWAPLIGVYQADATAEGKDYFGMECIYQSKTAVQGESDLIICMGRVHEQGKENIRFFQFPKHKLSGGGPHFQSKMKTWKHESLFNPETGVFK